MNPRRPNPLLILKLGAWLKKLDPDVVQTWLYHADLIGGLAARGAGIQNIYWNLRQTNLDRDHSKLHTILTLRLCAKLSYRLPGKIVCCAESASDFHADVGYSKEKMLVIANGVDVNRFRPDHKARERLRSELELPENAFVFGNVSRWDPQKDHATFIRAASMIGADARQTFFVLCGDGIEAGNTELRRLVDTSNVGDRIKLLGVRDDIHSLIPAFDIFVSPSAYGEGLSNAILEAMACGTPCVVTDVGESRAVVGDTGWVVPPSDAPALADQLDFLQLMPSASIREFRQKARARVELKYNLDRTIESYGALYRRAT